MGAMIGTVVLSLNGATTSNVRATLTDRFATTRSAVESGKTTPSQAVESSVDSIEDSTWLYDEDGNLIEGPKAGRRVRAVADRLGSVSRRTWSPTTNASTWRARSRSRRVDSGPGVLVVSESLEPYESNRTEVLIGLIALGLLVTAGATASQPGRCRGPSRRSRPWPGLAEDWSERELDARFDDRGSENEIAHLGRRSTCSWTGLRVPCAGSSG